VVRTIFDKIIAGGNTVSIYVIDLTKSFDKVNHNSLFMKLMKRHIPLELLELLENWVCQSVTVVSPEKRLNRSRYRLGCGLGWAKGTVY